MAAALPDPEPQSPPQFDLQPDRDAGDEAAPRRARRGSRGGRGRRGRGAAASDGAVEAAEPEAVAVAAPAEPKPRARRGRAAAPEGEDAIATAAPAAPRRTRARKPVEVAPDLSLGDHADGTIAAILAKLDDHGRELRRLRDLVESGAGAPAGAAAANLPRVGVFVDVANVELAIERSRSRIDWGKVLEMLTRGRRLVRAVAYSPVHEDLGVSLEAQRFAEPFIGKGYTIITKPLKRFADGSIKANVDVELALDVYTMVDRLDIVCLVSGDGDFQRLVEMVQEKGVRVEVVSVATSTAGGLRRAADEFIDLGARLRELGTTSPRSR